MQAGGRGGRGGAATGVPRVEGERGLGGAGVVGQVSFQTQNPHLFALMVRSDFKPRTNTHGLDLEPTLVRPDHLWSGFILSPEPTLMGEVPLYTSNLKTQTPYTNPHPKIIRFIDHNVQRINPAYPHINSKPQTPDPKPLKPNSSPQTPTPKIIHKIRTSNG